MIVAGIGTLLSASRTLWESSRMALGPWGHSVGLSQCRIGWHYCHQPVFVRLCRGGCMASDLLLSNSMASDNLVSVTRYGKAYWMTSGSLLSANLCERDSFLKASAMFLVCQPNFLRARVLLYGFRLVSVNQSLLLENFAECNLRDAFIGQSLWLCLLDQPLRDVCHSVSVMVYVLCTVVQNRRLSSSHCKTEHLVWWVLGECCRWIMPACPAGGLWWSFCPLTTADVSCSVVSPVLSHGVAATVLFSLVSEMMMLSFMKVSLSDQPTWLTLSHLFRKKYHQKSRFPLICSCVFCLLFGWFCCVFFVCLFVVVVVCYCCCCFVLGGKVVVVFCFCFFCFLQIFL